MKLLRACFHNFQCIFHLANLIIVIASRKIIVAIKICIWYVLKYFEEFIQFCGRCCGHMNFWQTPGLGMNYFGSGCATMWLDSIFWSSSKFFPYSQEMICTMNCNIIFFAALYIHESPILDLSDIPAQFTCLRTIDH